MIRQNENPSSFQYSWAFIDKFLYAREVVRSDTAGHQVKSAVCKRQGFGIDLSKTDIIYALGAGLLFCGFEHFLGQVSRYHALYQRCEL